MKTSIKTISIYIMGLGYMAVGIMHFVNPDFFLKIMPPYLPWHLELVYLSGVCEIFLGGLLLLPKYRFYAGWGLILLLIAVFPANIYLAQSETAQQALGVSQEAAIIRMPFQLVMIALAYWHSKP